MNELHYKRFLKLLENSKLHWGGSWLVASSSPEAAANSAPLWNPATSSGPGGLSQEGLLSYAIKNTSSEINSFKMDVNTSLSLHFPHLHSKFFSRCARSKSKVVLSQCQVCPQCLLHVLLSACCSHFLWSLSSGEGFSLHSHRLFIFHWVKQYS